MMMMIIMNLWNNFIILPFLLFLKYFFRIKNVKNLFFVLLQS